VAGVSNPGDAETTSGGETLIKVSTSPNQLEKKGDPRRKNELNNTKRGG